MATRAFIWIAKVVAPAGPGNIGGVGPVAMDAVSTTLGGFVSENCASQRAAGSANSRCSPIARATGVAMITLLDALTPPRIAEGGAGCESGAAMLANRMKTGKVD